MSGTPTISTDIFALPELVEDGVTGWTLPVELDADLRWRHIGRADARDAWENVQARLADGLADAIGTIATDRELAATRGQRARERIAALYGIDVAAAHLQRLYEAAIGRA